MQDSKSVFVITRTNLSWATLALDLAINQNLKHSMKMVIMIDVLRYLYAPGRLNGRSDLRRHEDEIPFRYAQAEIRTQLVMICGSTRYQPVDEEYR